MHEVVRPQHWPESLEYLRALLARIGELSGGYVEVEPPHL